MSRRAGASSSARHPTPDSDTGSGTVTAAAVQIIASSNGGQCPDPRGHRRVAGAVATISGDTFTFAATGTAAQMSVSVTDMTRYVKRLAADAQAISPG